MLWAEVANLLKLKVKYANKAFWLFVDRVVRLTSVSAIRFRLVPRDFRLVQSITLQLERDISDL